LGEKEEELFKYSTVAGKLAERDDFITNAKSKEDDLRKKLSNMAENYYRERERN